MGGRGESELSRGVRFPENEAQLKHMFADRDGYLIDTKENRKLVLSIIKKENYIGIKSRNKKYYFKQISTEKQVWCEVRNGVVQNCGSNNPPLTLEEINNYLRR